MTILVAVCAGIFGSYVYNVLTSPGAEYLREEGKKRRRKSGYEK